MEGWGGVSSCVSATKIKVTRSFGFLRSKNLSDSSVDLREEEKKNTVRAHCVTRQRDLTAEQNVGNKKKKTDKKKIITIYHFCSHCGVSTTVVPLSDCQLLPGKTVGVNFFDAISQL